MLGKSNNAEMESWRSGYGAISHTPETQNRIAHLSNRLKPPRSTADGVGFFELLSALDRVCNAGMWLVVHQTYARNVYLDGRPLASEDFKPKPDGHTGGSLNMVPAYAGYLAANAVSGITRGWLMGQGHCVSAIDSLNLLVGNMTTRHADRYSLTDEGLTRYVRDFYSYALRPDGELESPLGSHVNACTGGGLSEGGYLGFAELQYVHMPLPGERLVTFLSDGAFEEQRGSDWAARWWRAEDSGLVMPIMISNGRRIDQRTTMSQQGGIDWFLQHLRLNSFDPIVFDGRDPAAFVWAILEMEHRLEAIATDLAARKIRYPVRLPYGVAIAPKGAGFAGEGTNLAHNLPLVANPAVDAGAMQKFNEGTRTLWVRPEELKGATALFQKHAVSGRVRERDNPFVDRRPQLKVVPSPPERAIAAGVRDNPEFRTHSSPMQAIDEMFAAIVEANPHLRPRVGNPDEMRSNRLIQTLERLKFRVTEPEPGIPESIQGAVITALNEEAVVSAALANKGGINLVHTYEAFATKMHGAVRQEIIFAENCSKAGRPPGWLSVPVILTSHTWENGKNEHSHQDPAFAEAMMGESTPFSRVLFPADFNSAAALMEGIYRTQGQIWTVVVPKADSIPDLFTLDEARQLLNEGVLRLGWSGYAPERARVALAAVGAYQLGETLRASRRLTEREIPHLVMYWMEPGRMSSVLLDALLPATIEGAIFSTHTRPHAIWGLAGPLSRRWPLRVLGYQNRGGTLNTPGMLMVNRCTWAHILLEAAQLLNVPAQDVLAHTELAALYSKANPLGSII